MSVLMGKGVSVHAEAPQYAYETKFVVDADNAKIQLTAIGNAIGFEFETTYEEKNNVSITGWQYIGGKWYYYEELGMEYPGVMAKDCVMTIGDSEYLFDANGCMLTGWQKRSEGWYYADSSGRIKKGWQCIWWCCKDSRGKGSRSEDNC